MGWLISVSGLDGAGKSTLIDTITEKIEAAGHPVTFVRIRLGFTPLLEQVKNLADGKEKDLSAGVAGNPTSQTVKKNAVWKIYRLVSMLDLILLFLWIRLLRLFGKRVITDRFHWDNRIIYQEKYGDPGWFMQLLWKIVRGIAGKPFASFLLMIPAEESFRRVVARNQGEFEESLETLERRAKLYASLDQSELIKIKATQSPEKVFQLAWSYLEGLIA